MLLTINLNHSTSQPHRSGRWTLSPPQVGMPFNFIPFSTPATLLTREMIKLSSRLCGGWHSDLSGDRVHLPDLRGDCNEWLTCSLSNCPPKLRARNCN